MPLRTIRRSLRATGRDPRAVARALSAALVIGAFVAPQDARAGLCEEIFKQEIERESAVVGEALLSIFRQAEASETPPKSALLSTARYYVTVTEGTANTIDCDHDVVRSVYFPLGLLLKPLRDIQLDEATYTLFHAEYGLQLLIDQRAVAPVTEGDLYVFSDSADTHPLCPEASDDCSPRRLAQEPSSENWPFVHGRWSYLHTQAIPEAAETLDAVHRWKYGDSDDETAPWSLEVGERGSDPEVVCRLLSGHLYQRGMAPERHGGASAYPYQAFSLSPCVDPPAGASDAEIPETPLILRRVKYVTYESAEKHFEGLWSATVFKSLGSVSTLLEQALNFEQPFSSRKECSEEATRNNSMTIGASAELKLWNIGGVLGSEVTAQLVQRFDQDRQYVVRSYLHHAAESGAAGAARWPPFFDIQLIARCEGGRPIEPEKIEVESPLTWKKVELFIDQLDEHYDIVAGGPVGRPSESVQRERLDAGYIFVIADFNEYYYWRDVLRAEFDANPVLNDIQPAVSVPRDVLTDFFAHLVMSAALQSNVDTKVHEGS